MKNWMSSQNELYIGWIAVIGVTGLDNPFVTFSVAKKPAIPYPTTFTWKLFSDEVARKVNGTEVFLTGIEKAARSDLYQHLYTGAQSIIQALRDTEIAELIEAGKHEEADKRSKSWASSNRLKIANG